MPDTATKYDSNWFTDSKDLGPPKVIQVQSTDASSDAKAIVAAFRKGTAKAFLKLDREDVANDMDFQIRFPDAFRQRQSPFCGIAAFVRIWAYDQPAAYFKLAADLFEKGYGRLEAAGKHTGQLIAPSPELKASPPLYGMPQLDWMVMASVRESLNNDFNQHHSKTVFQMTGGTSLPRIEMEFRAGGYTKVVKSLKSDSTYQRMLQASDLYEKGWRVILVIQPWLLKATEREGLLARNSDDTHAVGLDSEIVISDFRGTKMVVPFDVWSWGATYSVPHWKKEMPLQTYDPCFSYVAGKF